MTNTAQDMKFFIKDFFSQCDQIRSFLEWKTSFFVQCKFSLSWNIFYENDAFYSWFIRKD